MPPPISLMTSSYGRALNWEEDVGRLLPGIIGKDTTLKGPLFTWKKYIAIAEKEKFDSF